MSRPTTQLGKIVAPIAALALLASPASALTDEEIFRDLRFNFINPGGRSLGMGGAFISLADDATAAQANPAGLTTLLSPQLFLEIRSANSDDANTSRDFRDPFLPDEGFDVNVQTSSDGVFSPSFFSYVYPMNRVSFGFSRQELINISNTTSNSYEFLFSGASDFRNGEGSIDLELVNWNASIAFKAHERLRLGLTGSFGELDQRSNIVNTYVDPTGTLIGDPNLAGVPLEMYQTATDDSDTDFTVTAGLLWQIIDTVSFGAVYRQGGDFEVEETMTARTIDQGLVPGLITQTAFFNQAGTFVTAQDDTFSFNNEIHIPDVLGAGVSWRPIPNLTLALDAVQISYSDLIEGFDSRLNVLTVGFQDEEDAAFTADDQTNLHFGAEYVYRPKQDGAIFIFRGGMHQDKDNKVRSDFPLGGFGLGSNDNFPGRDDEDHFSVGVGVVLGNHFQLDTAIDTSSLGTEGVLSMIYKF